MAKPKLGSSSLMASFCATLATTLLRYVIHHWLTSAKGYATAIDAKIVVNTAAISAPGAPS